MFRERALRSILIVVGLLFILGIIPIVMSLMQPKAETIPMMMSLYVTLGVFLLLAVRDPRAHRSLIGFTAWSSFAHGAVMVVQSIRDVEQRIDLLIGTAVLVVIGVALLALMPGTQAVVRGSAEGA